MKLIKIWNPENNTFKKDLMLISSETEQYYKCGNFRCSKDSNKVLGTCLLWRFASEDEIQEYVLELKAVPIIEYSRLVDYIKLFSDRIIEDDLCSDGRELFYIAEHYIEKDLENLGITDKFIVKYNDRYQIAKRTLTYNIEFDFENLSDELMTLVLVWW